MRGSFKQMSYSVKDFVEKPSMLLIEPPRGRQPYFTFASAPDPLFKASKAPFLNLRLATPSGAPRQAPLELRCPGTTPKNAPRVRTERTKLLLVASHKSNSWLNTVSNTELSEFACPHRVPGRELSEFLSPFFCVTKRAHRVFHRTHRVRPQTQ